MLLFLKIKNAFVFKDKKSKKNVLGWNQTRDLAIKLG
jgi:hypothetical protein